MQGVTFEACLRYAYPEVQALEGVGKPLGRGVMHIGNIVCTYAACWGSPWLTYLLTYVLITYL